jgi:hypothetical protein
VKENLLPSRVLVREFREILLPVEHVWPPRTLSNTWQRINAASESIGRDLRNKVAQISKAAWHRGNTGRSGDSRRAVPARKFRSSDYQELALS